MIFCVCEDEVLVDIERRFSTGYDVFDDMSALLSAVCNPQLATVIIFSKENYFILSGQLNEGRRVGGSGTWYDVFDQCCSSKL